MFRRTQSPLSNLVLSPTGISYSKVIGSTPRLPFRQGGARTAQIHRYLISPVEGKQLPTFELARITLARAAVLIPFDLRSFFTLRSNGRGGLLLETPEDRGAALAMDAFLKDLDLLVAIQTNLKFCSQ